MPFVGNHVIHPRWSEHHRPVASGSHTGTCAITRTVGTGYQDDDGVWHPPVTVTVYTGPCRITAPAPSRTVVVGEQQTEVADYEVAIEWGAAAILERDLITVTAAPDPNIIGKQLIVTDVRYAAERFEKVLKAQINLTDPPEG